MKVDDRENEEDLLGEKFGLRKNNLDHPNRLSWPGIEPTGLTGVCPAAGETPAAQVLEARERAEGQQPERRWPGVQLAEERRSR